MDFKTLNYTSQKQARIETGFSYIGNVNSSSKIVKNEKYNELTYVIYLAPAKSSGYNVCPKATSHCIAACLNESGRNRINVANNINRTRVKKTQLFYENRPFFMAWVKDEIEMFKKRAANKGMHFSVRLNGTSDLSPEIMNIGDLNVLEYFKDVQFYDYTKVLRRTLLTKKHKNYDLTFSFSGENWNECEQALNDKVRVAVVFEKTPKKFKGIKVVNGDNYDMRYNDPKKCIIGLKFKKVRNKINLNDTPFVITENNPENQY